MLPLVQHCHPTNVLRSKYSIKIHAFENIFFVLDFSTLAFVIFGQTPLQHTCTTCMFILVRRYARIQKLCYRSKTLEKQFWVKFSLSVNLEIKNLSEKYVKKKTVGIHVSTKNLMIAILIGKKYFLELKKCILLFLLN